MKYKYCAYGELKIKPNYLRYKSYQIPKKKFHKINLIFTTNILYSIFMKQTPTSNLTGVTTFDISIDSVTPSIIYNFDVIGIYSYRYIKVLCIHI